MLGLAAGSEEALAPKIVRLQSSYDSKQFERLQVHINLDKKKAKLRVQREVHVVFQFIHSFL